MNIKYINIYKTKEFVNLRLRCMYKLVTVIVGNTVHIMQYFQQKKKRQ